MADSRYLYVEILPSVLSCRPDNSIHGGNHAVQPKFPNGEHRLSALYLGHIQHIVDKA